MSKLRRSSIRRSNKELKNQRGANGHRLCRFCKNEVQPPRRTFCGNKCVHEWKLRSDVKYLRHYVYERDLGKCALCKVDTRYQKIRIEDLLYESNKSKIDRNYKAYLKTLNITEFESQKSIWHADHIKPVKMGGGESGLENIRTLCVKCHKLVTKSQIKNAKKKTAK